MLVAHPCFPFSLHTPTTVLSPVPFPHTHPTLNATRQHPTTTHHHSPPSTPPQHNTTLPPEYYVRGSGVIAVVVYGLYGTASYCYSLSSKGVRSGSLFKFLDVLSFILNAMVFFYVGSSIVNFFLRQVVTLEP